MSTAPDDFDFDFERSRAAVAVACLQWLGCTGPSTDPDRGTSPDPANRPRDRSPIVSPTLAPDPIDLPHPLWDRWLDG